MATISKAAMRPYRAGQRLVRGFKEAASETFKYGDVLQPVTTGANRVGIADTDETTILGVAAEDASGTTDTDISVWLAKSQDEWIGNLDGTLAAANLGTDYGIKKDSAGVWTVDDADTTNTRVRVVKLYDAVGDVNGRVIFKWLDTVIIHGTE